MSSASTSSAFPLRLAFVSSMGGVAFVVAFSLGWILNTVVGPAFGGLLNSFITAMVVGLAVAAVPKWWTPIVTWLVFSLLASATTTMGPPGPHKILIGILVGVVMATMFWLSTVVLPSWRRTWYFVIGATMSVLMTFLIFLAMTMLQLNPVGAAKLRGALPYVLPIYAVLGGAGFAFALRVYANRFANLPAFRKLNQQGD